MSSTLAPKGFWKLLEPVMYRASRKVAKTELDNLKRLLENPEQPAS